jgi:hypothetical protein
VAQNGIILLHFFQSLSHNISIIALRCPPSDSVGRRSTLASTAVENCESLSAATTAAVAANRTHTGERSKVTKKRNKKFFPIPLGKVFFLSLHTHKIFTVNLYPCSLAILQSHALKTPLSN